MTDKELLDTFDLDNIPKEELDAAYKDYEPLYRAYKFKSQEKSFNLTGIVNACTFNACRVFVSGIDKPEKLYEIRVDTDSELYRKLLKPEADGVELIRANYGRVEWCFYDRGVFQLRVELDVEEDSIHFFYDHFGLKLKNTLINILKSQKEWHSIGIAMFDNESGEVVGDSFYDETETGDDIWIHGLEQLCDEYVVDSRHASLFKAKEDIDGRTVDIIDIIIDTDSVSHTSKRKL